MVKIEYKHYSICYKCRWYLLSEGLHENFVADIIYLYTDYIFLLLESAVKELKIK